MVKLSYVSRSTGERVYVCVDVETLDEARSLVRDMIRREAQQEEDARREYELSVDKDILDVFNEDSMGRVRQPGGTEPCGKAKTMRECRGRMNSLTRLYTE